MHNVSRTREPLKNFNLVILAMHAVLLGCNAGLPTGEEVITSVVERTKQRGELDCRSFEIVDASSERNSHKWVLKADCRVAQSGVHSSAHAAFFGVTYVRDLGGWRQQECRQLFGDLVDSYFRSEGRYGGVSGNGGGGRPLFIFGVFGVLFGLIVFLLRRRKSHRLKTGAGPGLGLKRSRSRPAKPQNHWTVNPD